MYVDNIRRKEKMIERRRKLVSLSLSLSLSLSPIFSLLDGLRWIVAPHFSFSPLIASFDRFQFDTNHFASLSLTLQQNNSNRLTSKMMAATAATNNTSSNSRSSPNSNANNNHNHNNNNNGTTNTALTVPPSGGGGGNRAKHRFAHRSLHKHHQCPCP